MWIVLDSDMMSEHVSLFIWLDKANYLLVLSRLHLLYHWLKNRCHDNPSLRRVYLHNHWFKSYDLKTIWKPRWNTLYGQPSAKRDSNAPKRHTPPSSKSPNIATVSEPTVFAVKTISYPIYFAVKTISLLYIFAVKTISLFYQHCSENCISILSALL